MDCHPLTPDRWDDFEQLFGPRGACEGCWCMWWRLKRAEFSKNRNEGNRLAMKALVERGTVPGILAYHDGRAAGWCSVGPRADFGPLNRSPVLKPLDDQPVWSIVCLFVHDVSRGKGLAIDLIKASVDYVKQNGGSVVEAYPTTPREQRTEPGSIFMGLPEMFARAGFVEVARPSRNRMIMRCFLER